VLVFLAYYTDNFVKILEDKIELLREDDENLVMLQYLFNSVEILMRLEFLKCREIHLMAHLLVIAQLSISLDRFHFFNISFGP
jgi:hypothetical protein